MGGFSHRARDLVGDRVLVRSDGVDAEDVGEDGGGEVSLGRGGGRAAGIAAAILAALPPGRLLAQDTTAGKQVYVKWCAGCHGETGAGDGPAAGAMLPRPRNFT